MSNINFLYVCPPLDNPVGGVKVIYRHSEILVKLGFNSMVYHLEDPTLNFNCNWFKNNAIIKRDRNLNCTNDHLILPDAAATVYFNDAINIGIKYSIFVQNPYQIFPSTSDFHFGDRVKQAFKNAQFVIAISDYVKYFLECFFPELNLKIYVIYPGLEIDHTLPYPKFNRISYMSRKLTHQSDYVCYALKNSIPSCWDLVNIHNQSEADTYRILSESKIFLSFSSLEGFGLPPLEAAFFKNIVVGYTGQGGIQYFQKPIFHSVESEDILSMISKTTDLINYNSFHFDASCERQLDLLSNVYSCSNTAVQLKMFADSVTCEFDNL